jgi:hypothetical protein
MDRECMLDAEFENQKERKKERKKEKKKKKENRPSQAAKGIAPSGTSPSVSFK